jgi:DNA replication protein DnaC
LGHEVELILLNKQSWKEKKHVTIVEGTITDAILYRMVHPSHRVELTGESIRKNKMKKT